MRTGLTCADSGLGWGKLSSMNSKNSSENLGGPNISAEYAQVLARFPEELQKLVADEVADGNASKRSSMDFRLPPAARGESVKLARQVKAQRKVSTNGVDFYARNNPQYSGEFTTQQRHFIFLFSTSIAAGADAGHGYDSRRDCQSNAMQTPNDFKRRFNRLGIVPFALT